VAAKPAEQTPLVACAAARALRGAGVPPEVLALLPGAGETVGAALTGDARIKGVAFTGSVATARRIHAELARRAEIVPLIAETGGLNCMVADSSALPEQVATDALVSAFDSAGQRCSSLRLLLLQEDIAGRVIELLCGAMDELRIGDPLDFATDIGPLIDEAALRALASHLDRIGHEAVILHRSALPPECRHGTHFAPTLVEVARPDTLREEVFGPILHVLRYRPAEFDDLLDCIQAAGYGLTLGIQSRIDGVARRIRKRVRVGNCYVNRSMIGAQVGMQPFGGEGLSGTGPKAGGPHYLGRFAVERVLTTNTAALGGNAALLGSLRD
jgi:RHH-type proline utilization regulon transcriptional repressor/proline dehydrogenase/delta 1-pyrroline-5-carboxylate dehydrogenase